MRRKIKGMGLAKTLTAAAVVAAISTGAVSVYASQNIEWLEIGNDDNRIRIRVSDLLDSPEYRQRIIDIFHAGDELLFGGVGEDTFLYEMSMLSTNDNILTPIHELADDSPYLPYTW